MESLKLTFARLKKLKKNGLIRMRVLELTSHKMIYVSRGPKATDYYWRLTKYTIRHGFKHFGGPTPWMANFKDGIFWPPKIGKYHRKFPRLK